MTIFVTGNRYQWCIMHQSTKLPEACRLLAGAKYTGNCAKIINFDAQMCNYRSGSGNYGCKYLILLLILVAAG